MRHVVQGVARCGYITPSEFFNILGQLFHNFLDVVYLDYYTRNEFCVDITQQHFNYVCWCIQNDCEFLNNFPLFHKAM